MYDHSNLNNVDYSNLNNIDYSNLNKACLKDSYPFFNIEKLVDNSS